MSKNIKIVGIGMDGFHTLTEEGKNAIMDAQVLIGASRMVDAVLSWCERKEKEVFISFQYSEIVTYIENSPQGKIVILMSGDTGFFSGCEGLLSVLKSKSLEWETEVICSISTPVYLCSKAQETWQDMYFVSLHGVMGNIVRNVQSHEKTFFLLGGEWDASFVLRRLCEYGLGELQVIIGENLGNEKEKITRGTAFRCRGNSYEKLSALIVLNPQYNSCKRTGISDEEFVRGEVPITKAEVRSICISKLKIREKDICIDIGCGTGSVSVEMALQCNEGKVYAIDKESKAIALTKQNQVKFGCDNIEAIEGEAQDVLKTLPAPDVVFIGGTKGHLSEVIQCVLEKNRKARVVTTAVTLETLQEMKTIMEQSGLHTEMTQVSIARLEKKGSFNMFVAQNPIFVLSMEGYLWQEL